jgi:hypothetical protein
MILYFVPKGSKAKAPDHCTTYREVQTGPGGLGGLVYSNDDGKTGYYPDSQSWSQAEEIWIGVDRDPIKPESLLRKEIIGGHSVRLEDGNDWIIPVARAFPSGTRLPEALILGPDGQLISEVLPRFAQFSTDANRVYDALAGDGEMSVVDAWEIAVKALGFNYYIGRREVSLLKLLTTANIIEILKAIIDYPTVMEALKKKAPDAGSMSAGSAD